MSKWSYKDVVRLGAEKLKIDDIEATVNRPYSGGITKTSYETLSDGTIKSVETDSEGKSATTYKLHGKYHRVGGPAWIMKDGTAHHYLFGLLHRDDGPAIDGSSYHTYYAFGKYANVYKSCPPYPAPLDESASIMKVWELIRDCARELGIYEADKDATKNGLALVYPELAEQMKREAELLRHGTGF